MRKRSGGSVSRGGQIEPRQAFGDLAGFALGLLLRQGVDPFDGREEADFPAMVLDGLDAQSGGGMGLCGSGTADQHDVLGAIEKRAFVQLSPHGLVDLAGHEVEADQVFVSPALM